VAGYTASANSAQVTQLLQFGNSSITFYWVKASGAQPYAVTYSYCMMNNKCSQPATAQFAVDAPTNLNVTVHTDVERISPIGPSLMIGSNVPPAVAGITFAVAANIPVDKAGPNQSWQWVQLLVDNVNLLKRDGVHQCSLRKIGYTGNPNDDVGPLNDNYYPYPIGFGSTPDHTEDSPGGGLGNELESEFSRRFTATMYLMWDPALKADGSGGCTPAKSTAFPLGRVVSQGSDCDSIPVPLGFISWHATGDAINSLDLTQGTHGWILGCPDPSVAGDVAFQQRAVFPVWKADSTNAKVFDDRWGCN
jgi:hypothetical protein